MNKEDLLFYDAYEAFYAMAEKSNAFRALFLWTLCILQKI